MYLATTFSPSMLTPGCYATVEECDLEMIKSYWLQIESVVSHEATAEVLSTLLEFKVEFNRTNVTLGHGDILFAVIPKFRASEAREFTRKEVESAGYRAFYVEVWNV